VSPVATVVVLVAATVVIIAVACWAARGERATRRVFDEQMAAVRAAEAKDAAEYETHLTASRAMQRAHARGARRAAEARSIPPTSEEIDAAITADVKLRFGPEVWWACPEHREPVLARRDQYGGAPRCPVRLCSRFMLRVRS